MRKLKIPLAGSLVSVRASASSASPEHGGSYEKKTQFRARRTGAHLAPATLCGAGQVIPELPGLCREETQGRGTRESQGASCATMMKS